MCEDANSQLGKWRVLQGIQMPNVTSMVESQPQQALEDENLFLPSSIPEPERTALGLSALAGEEARLREAQAHECILQLRTNVKCMSILAKRKKKHDRGVRKLTRTRARFISVEVVRDRLLLIYNSSRAALISLGKLDPNDQRLPPLTVDDLKRKSTVDKRQRGDTYRSDGGLWVIPGVSMASIMSLWRKPGED